ncbi:MAG: G5 domain-containing protein [Eubacterium sp.]|nr:G5 domain-containing protein [Eubacterium sp.]MDE6766620.1 G5 domain-containing protein [Eubacterium sp.]
MINQSNANGLKGFSRAVLTAVITFVLAIAIFATTAFAGLVTQYNVEVVIDSNDAIVITTNETEPIEILAQANITLADSDKLDISAFTSGEGGTIKIDKANSINVEFDGAISTYTMYEDTVGDALSALGITVGANDRINYQLTDAVKDGMVITIKTAKFVTLNADGQSVKYAIYKGTVADLLSLAQITLGENDYTNPSLETELKENMSVDLFRVELKTVIENESIAYDTITQADDSEDRGTQTVITEGVNGEEKVSYEIKYVNGEETEKTEISRVTVKEAVDKVVKVGTNEPDVEPNGVTTQNGYTIGQTISGRYTHYCACGICGSGTGVTASGRRVYNGMDDPYYIACNWLPMGSVVNVDGTNYTVVDRGGSGLSSSGRIDIFTPEGHSACFKYGTGSCTIEIVRLGW